MPGKAKPLEYYPSIYRDTLRKCIEEKREVLIDAEDRVQANRLRGQFYAFVGSLRREADRVQVRSNLVPLSESEQEILLLANMSTKVMVGVEDKPDGTATLRMTNREQSWQARAFANARLGDVIPDTKRMTESGAVVTQAEQDSAQWIIDQVAWCLPAFADALDGMIATWKADPAMLARHPKVATAIQQHEEARDARKAILAPKVSAEVEAISRDAAASYGARRR